VEAPPERLAPGTLLRFRARLRRIPVGGEIRVLALAPGRVRARVRLGLLAFEVRLALGPEPGIGGASRIGLVLVLGGELPLVGGCLDRFAARRLVSEVAERALAALASVAEERELAAERA
jgi:hypothetical protein